MMTPFTPMMEMIQFQEMLEMITSKVDQAKITYTVDLVMMLSKVKRMTMKLSAGVAMINCLVVQVLTLSEVTVVMTSLMEE